MGILHNNSCHWISAAAFAFLFFATALGICVEGSRVGPLEREYKESVTVTGRQLAGPGSSPPTCQGRCGRCFPCRPVRVAIQPGRIVPTEYYPEAWRCKCGNKLFMP